MIWILRILTGLAGLLFLAIGLRFFFAPELMTETVSVYPRGAAGLSSFRADFGAFFIGVGVAALAGLAPGQRRLLLVAALFVALAFLARGWGMATGGGYDWLVVEAMLVEAITIAILVGTYVVSGPRRIAVPADDEAGPNGSSGA